MMWLILAGAFVATQPSLAQNSGFKALEQAFATAISMVSDTESAIGRYSCRTYTADEAASHTRQEAIAVFTRSCVGINMKITASWQGDVRSEGEQVLMIVENDLATPADEHHETIYKVRRLSSDSLIVEFASQAFAPSSVSIDHLVGPSFIVTGYSLCQKIN